MLSSHCMARLKWIVSKTVVIAVIGFMVLLCAGVTAEETGWTNATSEGKFTFMLPSGWTYSVIDTSAGKAETLTNIKNPNGTYLITLTDTQVEEGTAKDVAKIGLEGFMKAQNMNPVEDYDVTYSETDNVATVICSDPQGSIYSVVFYPIGNKSLLLMGNYNNENQAEDEIETLVEIVKTAKLI